MATKTKERVKEKEADIRMDGNTLQVERDLNRQGELEYEEWKESLHADPEYQALYEEEATKRDLWLQLVEARRAAGLTQAELARRMGVSQAQVARIEKCGYEDYNLNTLRRYVEGLGRKLEVAVV